MSSSSLLLPSPSPSINSANLSLQRKVTAVLSSKLRFDNPTIQTAVAGLSTVFPINDNTPDNRRQLRSILEHNQINSNNQLITAFSSVYNEFNQLESALLGLDSICNELTQRLQQTRQSTSSLLSSTESLQLEKESNEQRSILVNTVLNRFQLTPIELAALDRDINNIGNNNNNTDINNNSSSQSQSIDPTFFAALERINTIKSDCRSLLLLQSHHQRLGLDILESLGRRLDSGLEQLYKWAQLQSQSIIHNQSLNEANPDLVRALLLLKQQPIYYQNCIQAIILSRRSVLIQRFMRALTSGSTISVRPIELHAHDPIRYVSDMLAWVHQSLANEKEFLLTLFTAPTAPVTDNTESIIEAGSLLSAIFEGLLRPLTIRVEQALQTQSTPQIAFKLWNIIEFYTSIIAPLFPSNKNNTNNNNNTVEFSSGLLSLIDLGRNNFYELVSKQSEKLSQPIQCNTNDLTLNYLITESLNQLINIMSIYQSSLIVSTESRDIVFQPILNSLLDPLLKSIKLGSTRLNKIDNNIYSINYLFTIITALKKFNFVRSRIETLTFELDNIITELIELQSNKVLEKGGLKEKLLLIKQYNNNNNNTNNTVLSTVPGLDLPSLLTVIQSFYSNLSASGSFLIPQCDRLLNNSIMKLCRESIARSISSQYLLLYSTIKNPSNQYNIINTINTIPSPEQINLLLELNDSNRILSSPINNAIGNGGSIARFVLENESAAAAANNSLSSTRSPLSGLSTGFNKNTNRTPISASAGYNPIQNVNNNIINTSNSTVKI